jgi:hypothetical protein
MDKKNNRLFIHKDMEHVTLEHSVEIILTPQFYTFIRENLDVRFSYQAKQIAASLFDDYLENTEETQYHVDKCGSLWCFFAYNIEEIDKFLESVGIEKHRVSKIYFAQQLKNELEAPIELSNRNILQTIDETVTIIPHRLMDPDLEYQLLNLSEIKLNSGVTMGASLNSFISLKETIILSSLFFILGTLFSVEGNRIKSSIENDNNMLTQLLDENPKYTSSLLRNSILDKYRPIDKTEREKRQSIKDISKLLSAKSELINLNIEKNKISANIKTYDQTINQQVSSHAKTKMFKTSNTGLDVKVEKSL